MRHVDLNSDEGDKSGIVGSNGTGKATFLRTVAGRLAADTGSMVTIEDIIEEIVGEIQDEFDQERPLAEKRDECLYSIDAKLLLEEVCDILEMDIEADNIDTIGGWLYNNVQSPPSIGMKASWNGRDFFVEEMDNLRITRILAKLPKPLAEEHDEIVDMTENGQKDENAAKQ